MKQFVVYTVQTGGYDIVQQPLVVDERFDYILFSDSIEKKTIGVWQVRPIPYDNVDLTRASRYPKMHPHELLSDYIASLYIDANIQIIKQSIYDRAIECYTQGVDWAGIAHPIRDCIYDEAYVVYGLDYEDNIFRWCHQLRKENYPRNRGLYENNIIFRTHNKIVEKVNVMWWNLYERYTRRDQLLLFYVFWKIPDIKTAFFLRRGEHAWNSDAINIFSHHKNIENRKISESFLEYTRRCCRFGMTEKMVQFKEFHYWLYGKNLIVGRLGLFLWGLYVLIVYGIIIKYRVYKREYL